MNTTSNAMHDATKPQPRAADNTLQPRAEAACMVNGKATGGNTPGRTGGIASTTNCCDVIQILKVKRDRYKGRDKMIQARTVQACIDELMGVWK